jgi:predicted nucleotidyltransferase
MDQYRRAAREREKALTVQISARRQRALGVARRAVEVLKSEFEVERVILFGSLVHEGQFHLRSDIDLAVWGGKNYFKAVSRLLDLDLEFEFDLLPMEDVRPDLKRIIEKEGIEL